MLLLCLAPLAMADEGTDESEETTLRTITLTPAEDLDSALDHFDDAIEDTEGMPAELAEVLEEAMDTVAILERLPAGLVAPRMRGRFFLRPTLSLGGLDQHSAVRLGIAGGHRWWRISDSTLALAGETRLAADAPLSGASGGALALTSLAGPWIGPIGLRIGPAVRYERADYGEATLDAALTAGGRAILSAEIGSVSPYLGGGIDRIIAGDRSGEFEPIALVGLSREKGWVRLAAQGSLQQTAQGVRWEAGIGIQITPHLSSAEDD